LVEFLLDNPSAFAASTALDLVHFYYRDEESEHVLPQDLTFRVLTHPAVLEQQGQGSQRDQMDEYLWTEVSKSFIALYPEEGLKLADMILAHFGEDDTIFDGFYSETQSVLTEIIRLYPEEVWLRITEYLGPPIDARAFRIRQWLRGSDLFEAGDDGALKIDGALNLIPPTAIWDWVDSDVEQRGWYLAYFVPPKLFREEGRVCLAREVLVRYGDREDVRRNLTANYSTGGWIGSESLYHQRKRDQLLAFKEGEPNQNVRRWIEECVAALDHNIERATVEEEREDF
jgi:hypothetical protein